MSILDHPTSLMQELASELFAKRKSGLVQATRILCQLRRIPLIQLCDLIDDLSKDDEEFYSMRSPSQHISCEDHIMGWIVTFHG